MKFTRYPFLLLVMVFAAVMVMVPAQAQTEDDSLPWWNDRVFYEIFVRSFYDSDGDGIGDLQGVIEKLDYLNDGDPTTTDDLGITGIWLMPVFSATSYHGYDVIDYRSIAPEYGTIADLQELVAAAHERGIAVILDLVLNHTSVEHPWFIASSQNDPEYADWYLWQDEDPGVFTSSGATAWHRAARGYYYGQFWSGMPDLNLGNPAVTAELYDIARYWIEETGIDGYRTDAIKFLFEDGDQLENVDATFTWLQDFQQYLKSVDENVLVVGEIWGSTDIIANYVPEEVDIAFEFSLSGVLISSARGGSTGNLRQTISRMADIYPAGQFAPFLANHDMVRTISQVGDVNRAKLAASLLLTGPGVPFIYYGEEIGMAGSNPPDEAVRTPMQWDATPGTAGFTTGSPWRALADEAETYNVATMDGEADSLLNHYRALVNLRDASPALRQGETVIVDSSDRNVFAMLRQTADETVLVIINLHRRDKEAVTFTLDAGSLLLEDGTLTPSTLLGPVEAAPLTITDGGFVEYQAAEVLPAYSTTVLRLG